MGRLFGRFFAPSFIQETPTGTPDGTRTTFTLSTTPAAGVAVELFINGVRQTYTSDYAVSGTTITMTSAPAASQSLLAQYIKAN